MKKREINTVADIYYEYKARIDNLKSDIQAIIIQSKSDVEIITPIVLSPYDPLRIALSKVSIPIGNSYTQVKADLDATNRVSWAGTAHEIREMVSNLLRTLAPDIEIVRESWYKQEKDTSGPTQVQRVKFIIQKKSGGSKQAEVLKLVSQMEELIGSLVRATYSRASDAAHRYKDKPEAMKLLKYFEAFAYDLLDI